MKRSIKLLQNVIKSLYKFVHLRAYVKMESYINFLPSVNKSLVQECLAKALAKNVMNN
jgi:hypothetical protein